MHDANAGRTTGVDCMISELTLDESKHSMSEIRRSDAGGSTFREFTELYTEHEALPLD